MKEESDENEKIVLIYYVNESDRWIIDIGCLNHMMGDNNFFEYVGPYNGGCVKFGNDIPCIIKGNDTI